MPYSLPLNSSLASIFFHSPPPSPRTREWENLHANIPFSSFEQLQSTFLTLISSIFQLAALVWYLVSYFPMGSTGLQFVGRLGAQRVTAWINS